MPDRKGAVKTERQASMDDVPITNNRELFDACVDYAQNRDGYREYQRANDIIKEQLPAVSKETTFVIKHRGRPEEFAITVTPQEVDGYEVKARKQQRKRIVPAG